MSTEPRPISLAYWESVSENYELEVTSVWDEDVEGLVGKRIVEAGEAYPLGTAADVGCGVGKFTRILAECFQQVEACDWAENGLLRARDSCNEKGNTRFHKLDILCDAMPFAPVDLVLCVNVLLMPSLDERLTAWRAVANQVKEGGQLLLVVPSHESAQMELYQDIEAQLDSGQSCAQSQANCQSSRASSSDLQQGVFEIEGTRLKHYLEDELRMMLEEMDFQVQSIDRIEYGAKPKDGKWASWDWLVAARRLDVKKA